jgi:acetyl-CoA C-acetyltransferase
MTVDRPTDRSTPAIVGAAQAIQRPGDWTAVADARGPIELMVGAARDAAADAGAPSLLRRLGWVGVVGGLWGYRNPGQLVAAELGSPTAKTALSAISGSSPQELIGLAAERIARGQLDVALVVGGEAGWSERRIRAAGESPTWLTSPGDGTPERLPDFPDAAMTEMQQIGTAATAYALFDDSLRASRRMSIAERRREMAALWANFSRVAATNPFAWDPTIKSVTELADPTPDNRLIAFPYTKAFVANNTVDLASAILLCSVATATAFGIDTDRLVFPQVSTTSHETWRITDRAVLHETPALAAAGRAALQHVGITAAELDLIDLYACFPAIVSMSAAALGLTTDRALTTTGGLGLAGAPIANSTGQAIAAMVPRLRNGGWGFVHANGGLATKHALGIYSAAPSTHFERIEVTEAGDLPLTDDADRECADGPPAEGTVEAATVVFTRDGPSHVVAAVRSVGGARVLYRCDDSELIDLAMSDGLSNFPAPLPRATRLDALR